MKTNRVLKDKQCKQCGLIYTPKKALQRVCGLPCAIEQSRAKRIANNNKEARKRHKADKQRIKTRGQWQKEVQTHFNAFIRARDYDKPCISCQRHHQGQYHAGHYKAVGMGGASPLRFNEIGCHKQCSACNNHLGGNLILYRENLIVKIGLNLVEWLEGPHKPLQLTIDELKWLKKYYSQRARDAKKWAEQDQERVM
jgi:hypothetical protein